jgi:formate dehydrogenase subunit gamma
LQRGGAPTKAGAAAFDNKNSGKMIGEDAMAKLFAPVRFMAGALALAFIIATAAVAATPASAQQGPTAATSEQQLLNQLHNGVIAGQVSIPDKKAGNLIHPAGRDWRAFRTVTLPWVGGIAILGMLVVLALYYLTHGMMPIAEGRSGRTILRFNVFERFVHWLTAVSFVILALTGLNITFGRSLLLPLMGLDAFSTWSEWAKYTHNYISFAFTIGVVLMFLMWIANNLPTLADFEWFKSGGGMFGGKEPPAHKFNGGEKFIFWVAMIGGGLVIATGFVLLFPFYGTGVSGMELAQIVHSVVAVLYVSAMLSHIYMGTIGVEGAFEGMVDGTVDVNWAKERHSLWYEEEARSGLAQGQAMRPAE